VLSRVLRLGIDQGRPLYIKGTEGGCWGVVGDNMPVRILFRTYVYNTCPPVHRFGWCILIPSGVLSYSYSVTKLRIYFFFVVTSITTF
jgi:hypothetical protein